MLRRSFRKGRISLGAVADTDEDVSVEYDVIDEKNLHKSKLSETTKSSPSKRIPIWKRTEITSTKPDDPAPSDDPFEFFASQRPVETGSKKRQIRHAAKNVKRKSSTLISATKDMIETRSIKPYTVASDGPFEIFVSQKPVETSSKKRQSLPATKSKKQKRRTRSTAANDSASKNFAHTVDLDKTDLGKVPKRKRKLASKDTSNKKRKLNDTVAVFDAENDQTEDTLLDKIDNSDDNDDFIEVLPYTRKKSVSKPTLFDGAIFKIPEFKKLKRKSDYNHKSAKKVVTCPPSTPPDWTCSQVVGMDAMNREFLDIEKSSLDIVIDEVCQIVSSKSINQYANSSENEQLEPDRDNESHDLNALSLIRRLYDDESSANPNRSDEEEQFSTSRKPVEDNLYANLFAHSDLYSQDTVVVIIDDEVEPPVSCNTEFLHGDTVHFVTNLDIAHSSKIVEREEVVYTTPPVGDLPNSNISAEAVDQKSSGNRLLDVLFDSNVSSVGSQQQNCVVPDSYSISQLSYQLLIDRSRVADNQKQIGTVTGHHHRFDVIDFADVSIPTENATDTASQTDQNIDSSNVSIATVDRDIEVAHTVVQTDRNFANTRTQTDQHIGCINVRVQTDRNFNCANFGAQTIDQKVHSVRVQTDKVNYSTCSLQTDHKITNANIGVQAVIDRRFDFANVGIQTDKLKCSTRAVQAGRKVDYANLGDQTIIDHLFDYASIGIQTIDHIHSNNVSIQTDNVNAVAFGECRMLIESSDIEQNENVPKWKEFSGKRNLLKFLVGNLHSEEDLDNFMSILKSEFRKKARNARETDFEITRDKKIKDKSSAETLPKCQIPVDGCSSPLNSEEMHHFEDDDFSEDFIETKKLKKNSVLTFFDEDEDGNQHIDNDNNNVVIVPNSQPPPQQASGVLSSFDEDAEFLRNLSTGISQQQTVVEDSEKIKILDEDDKRTIANSEISNDGSVTVISPFKCERTVLSNNYRISSQMLENLEDFKDEANSNSGSRKTHNLSTFNTETVSCSTQVPPGICRSNFTNENIRSCAIPYVKIRDSSVFCCKNISPIKPMGQFIEKSPSPPTIRDFAQQNSNTGNDKNSKNSSKNILCFSGFGSSERAYITNFCEKFNCEFRRTFDSDVTHLITKTNNESGYDLCERTLKFFQAMADRVWIINHRWLDDCSKNNRLLPVETYVVQGDTVEGVFDGPVKVRTEPNLKPVFEGITIYCVEPFDNFSNKGELEDLFKKCGANILDSLDSLKYVDQNKRNFVVAQESEHSAKFFDDLYLEYRVPVVDIDYFLICISRYFLTPCRQEYVLCSRNLLENDYEMDLWNVK